MIAALAPSSLALALSATAVCDVYWNATMEQDGNVSISLVSPNAADSVQVSIPGAQLSIPQDILVSAHVDEPVGYWAIHVDWRDVQGSLQRTTLVAPTNVPSTDGSMMRPRWNDAWVTPQPLDLEGTGQYGQFVIHIDANPGVLLHMVKTRTAQPHPLEHARGDVDADGSVGIVDLLHVIDSWSLQCEVDSPCQGDSDFDGDVDTDDLLAVLSNFHKEEPTDTTFGETSGPPAPVTGSHVAWTWAPVTDESSTNLASMVWAANWRTPEQIAAESLNRPEGHRVIFFFSSIVNDLTAHPDDAFLTVDPETGVETLTPSPWIDHGIARVRRRMSNWIQEFVAAGGQLDAVIIDNETSLSAGRFIAAGADAWTPVMNDPRFEQLAQELGFSDLHQIVWGTDYVVTWNNIMATKFDAALNEAIFDVVHEAFPNAVCSNYGSYSQSADHPTLDTSGHTSVRVSPSCGTHDAREFYGRMTPSLGAATNPTVLDGPSLGEDEWGAMLLSIHRMRAIDLSNNRQMMAWVSRRDWPGDPHWPSQFVASKYYEEMILQLGMHGVSRFIYWLPHNVFHDAPTFNNPVEDQSRLDGLMRTLSERVGDDIHRQPQSQLTFDARIVATSITRGNTIVWRVTFRSDTTGVELQFADGQTVYLEPDHGSRGTWFEHDASRQLLMNASGSAPWIALAASL